MELQETSYQRKMILIIRPSNKSLQAIKTSIKEAVLPKGKAKNQDELIRELNPKIRGWCNYHSSAMSSKAFCYLDSYLFTTLYRWGLRKHRKKGKIWVKIRRYVKVINIRNLYIDTEYFRNGRKNREYECGYRYKGFVM